MGSKPAICKALGSEGAQNDCTSAICPSFLCSLNNRPTGHSFCFGDIDDNSDGTSLCAIQAPLQPLFQLSALCWLVTQSRCISAAESAPTQSKKRSIEGEAPLSSSLRSNREDQNTHWRHQEALRNPQEGARKVCAKWFGHRSSGSRDGGDSPLKTPIFTVRRTCSPLQLNRFQAPSIKQPSRSVRQHPKVREIKFGAHWSKLGEVVGQNQENFKPIFIVELRKPCSGPRQSGHQFHFFWQSESSGQELSFGASRKFFEQEEVC